MSVVRSIASSLTASENRTNTILTLICIGIGTVLGTVIAYLIVDGLWQFALVLLFALPAFVFLHRYPLAGLILWLWLTPFLVATDGGVSRKIYWLIHRALPLISLGIIYLSAWLRIHKRQLPKLGWAELFMVAYLVATELSIVYLSNDIIGVTFRFYDRIVIPMSLYLLVRVVNPKEKDLKQLVPIIIFILVSQSVIGIMSWIAPGTLPKAWLGRAGTRTTGSLRTPGAYTTTLMFCGSFLLHYALTRKKTLFQARYTALFLLSLFMVFMSFSRASWLACIVVVVVFFYLYPKFITGLSWLAIPAVILLISGGLLTDQISLAQRRFLSDNSESSALSRLPIIYASLKMLEAKPLLGWGYDNFDRYDRQFQGRVGDLVNAEKDHASHNVYLTLLAEQGLVGFFLFLAPMFWWLWLTIKALPNIPTEGFWSRKLVIIYWLIILTHIIVNNFSDIDLVFSLGMWWITLALIANITQAYLHPAPTKSSPEAVRSSLLLMH